MEGRGSLRQRSGGTDTAADGEACPLSSVHGPAPRSAISRRTVMNSMGYRQVFPSKYLQLVSPDFTFQVFSRGACPFSLISTTKSTRPVTGSFSMCGLAASGASTQKTDPKRGNQDSVVLRIDLNDGTVETFVLGEARGCE